MASIIIYPQLLRTIMVKEFHVQFALSVGVAEVV